MTTFAVRSGDERRIVYVPTTGKDTTMAPRSKRIETTVETARLVRAAKLCANIADPRSPIHVYSSVLVRISNDGCDITATDGKISARATVSLVPAGDQVSFCVNPKRLLEVASRMPGEYLQIASGETEVSISSGPGKASAKLAAAPAKDYPLPIFPEPTALVDRAVLAATLRKVTFAAVQDGLGVRSQVQLVFDGDKLWAWALNGHLVASELVPMAYPAAGRSIPASAARYILSALESSDHATVSLSVDDTLAVDVAGVSIIVRTDTANELDWLSQLPAPAMRLTCDSEDLVGAVARAATFAPPDKPDVRLATGEWGLRVSTGSPVDGSAATTVNAEGDRIDHVTAANWRYLRDSIAALDSDRVILEFPEDATLPITVRKPGAEEKQVYVIAPMTTT